MKVEKLIVKNIGIIEKEVIEINKPLNLFFGDIKSGKTTLAINSIKLLCGGTFSGDILRHGATEGYVKLQFDNANIHRSFHKRGDGTIKAAPIEFFKDNQAVKKPVEAIRKIINPFFLDQNFLLNKTSLEKREYFTNLFGVDTIELDKKIENVTSEAKELRANIKSFGEIEVVKVEKPNLDDLIKKRDAILLENKEKQLKHEENVKEQDKLIVDANILIQSENNIIETKSEKRKSLKLEIDELTNKMYDKTIEHAELEMWLEKNTKKDTLERVRIDGVDDPVELNSTVRISDEISNAKVNEVLYNQYQKALTMQEEKTFHQDLLEEKNNEKANLKKEKTNKLKEYSGNTGIKDFSFDADNNVVYQGNAIDMLSTSQMMELSTECANLYPNEIGIEIIDRAESLGKSIYTYINKAKKNKSTILATIVGEAPTNISEDIGVFVVKNGKTV